MKISTFWSTVVLIGALLLSVTACKNYDAKINEINENLAAMTAKINGIQAAIDAGKVIKSVEPVAGGFKITFTDNTSYDIINGVKGDTGAAGATGATGAKGADGKDGFTPVIGIDAQGYWTVVKTSGGAAERIVPETKASNVPEIGANGNWFINGVDTGKPSKGKDGADGAGTAGKNAYSPKISSTTGNWEIYDDTTQKYVDSGVSAGSNAPKVEVKDGYLYINDVNTKIGTTLFVSEANGTVTMKLPVGDGTYKTITVATVPAGALNGPVTLATITSINAPIIMVPMVLSAKYGHISINYPAAHQALRDEFAGARNGDVVSKSSTGSFLVNPADVDPTGYTISLENPPGLKPLINIKQEWKAFDYEDSFIKTRGAVKGGLYSLDFDFDYNAIKLFLNSDGDYEMKNLAVIVENPNNRYKLRTTYQYSVEIQNAARDSIISTSPLQVENNAVFPHLNKINCGTEVNFFDTHIEGQPFPSGVATIYAAADPMEYIYKSECARDNNYNGTNDVTAEEVAKYIEFTPTGFKSASTPEAWNALRGKNLYVIYRAVDYSGRYYHRKIRFTFGNVPKINVDLGTFDFTLKPTVDPISGNMNLYFINLNTAKDQNSGKTFFEHCAQYGVSKDDLWLANNGDAFYAVSHKTYPDNTSAGSTPVNPFNYYKEGGLTQLMNSDPVADWNSFALACYPEGNQPWYRGMYPGVHTFVTKYTSFNLAVTVDVTFKVNFSNPPMGDMIKRTSLFDQNDLLKVYGNSYVMSGFHGIDTFVSPILTQNAYVDGALYSQGAINDAPNKVYYNLSQAYSLSADADYKFMHFEATNTDGDPASPTYLNIPIYMVYIPPYTIVSQVYKIATNTIGGQYTHDVDVYYYMFNNPYNKALVDRIKVQGRSEIEDGRIEPKKNPDGTIKQLVLTNNVIEQSKNIWEYIVGYDAYGNDLNLFRTTIHPGAPPYMNERALCQSYEVLGSNAGLVRVSFMRHNVLPNGYNYVRLAFTATSGAKLETNVEIPVKITVTDKFGRSLTGTINILYKAEL